MPLFGRKKDKDMKKNILELYESGSEHFKEKFETLPLEKKAAAIAFITSMECKSKELERWLEENHAPLIAAVCREKMNEGYNLDKALELLKEEKEGIEARVLPPLEKTFQIKDFRISCYDIGFYDACRGRVVTGKVDMVVDGGKWINPMYTWLSEDEHVLKDLQKELKIGRTLKESDLKIIASMITTFYKRVNQGFEKASTKKVWTMKDYLEMEGKE